MMPFQCSTAKKQQLPVNNFQLSVHEREKFEFWFPPTSAHRHHFGAAVKKQKSEIVCIRKIKLYIEKRLHSCHCNGAKMCTLCWREKICIDEKKRIICIFIMKKSKFSGEAVFHGNFICPLSPASALQLARLKRPPRIFMIIENWKLPLTLMRFSGGFSFPRSIWFDSLCSNFNYVNAFISPLFTLNWKPIPSHADISQKSPIELTKISI